MAVMGVIRSAATAELDRGVVEYRFDRRGSATVVIFHGGHMNAGLAGSAAALITLSRSVLIALE